MSNRPRRVVAGKWKSRILGPASETIATWRAHTHPAEHPLVLALGNPRGRAEVPAERARKHLVATKANAGGNESNLPPARQKLKHSALEPQAQRISFRRFTQHLAKQRK